MIQSSYHQGDAVFRSRGRQCMVNSVCCILESKSSSPSTWTSATLDKILKDGDSVYQSLLKKNPGLEYLMPTDLPEIIFDTPMSVASPFSGTMNRYVTESPFFDINTAVSQIRETNPTGMIFTIGSSSPSYTSAIVWDDNQYYVFDPHSRNDCGMMCANGKATVTIHRNTAALCLHLKHLCASIFTNLNVPFELCAITMHEEIPNWDSDFESSSESGSDFSGFDPVSESELLLLKEKEQEIENFCETDIDENLSDLIEETLVSQLDDSTSCLDENFLNDITIIVEEQNEPCLSENATGTPSHRSSGNSENQKRKSRKRVRDESTWKRNILKHQKNTGQQYETASGTIKRRKIVKNGCGLNCRRKCHSKINCHEREKIFHNFWSSGSYEKQKEFISHTVLELPKKRILNKNNSRRKVSRQYFFQIHGLKIQVCKQFYLDTLDITEAVTNSAVGKKSAYGGITTKDQRGKHKNRPNKIPEEILTDIKHHIESFPRVESHYCRKSTNKEYLEGDLNLSKMYDLYKDQCSMNNYIPQSIHTYRYIFNTQYNIGFNKPLKDQCDFCVAMKNFNENNENSVLNTEFERHIKNKILARKEKEDDKTFAKTDESFVAACFDLQQVFTLPKSFQGQLYYARKLNNYNLTVYSLGNSDAYCYIWNETLANRGSNEISSCVFDFIKKVVAKGAKSITTYSDNCSGQNRNRYFVAMLWYCHKILKLKTVKHKFLEKGHTQNENDSVHSSIEQACKNISLYTTAQFATTVQMARRKHPYSVTEMTMDNFFDFKLMESNIKNLDIDENGNKLKWKEIRQIEFNDESPDCLMIKYDFDGDTHQVKLNPNLRKKSQEPKLVKLFQNTDRPKLSSDKYKDLIELCKKNIIPAAYHGFYEGLPHH